MAEYHWDKDADGIVTVTFDASGKSANTMNAAWVEAMEEIVARLRAETRLAGVVLASAKPTFFAGGDLSDIVANRLGADGLFAMIERNKAPFRAIERLPVPVVAAINGAALGGGYEMCLSANRRIVVDAPKAVVGLPEVTLGLLPGAGGIVRLTALIGLERALPLLLEGTALAPQAALAAGLVDEIVPTQADLVPAAKAWILAHPKAGAQPWDRSDFRYPGGDATSPKIRQIAMLAPAQLVARTRGLQPAPERILDLAVNSMRMGFESALRAESRGLAGLIPSREAKAAISLGFFGMQAVKSGRTRPEGERTAFARAGVIGAGMMGSGIAWAQASRGLATVLKDVSLPAAEKGKAVSARLVAKAVERGQMSPEQGAGRLSLIAPTQDDADLSGCDILIEAVFEDIDLKRSVIAEIFPRLRADGIFGSNTSTLPISVLADFAPDPSRFIGLHFFSPVDKMKIVEIIVGRKTSTITLRKAYDYVQQIGYLPIVVNDSRGFFTSRVFGTFMDEGLQLLRDGVDPVVIERAAWAVGMPVGPLAVHDEVSLELSRKAIATHRTLDAMLGVESGFGAQNTATASIVPQMCELGRRGRNWDGRGFYDYPAGGAKTVWGGLSRFVAAARNVPVEDVKDRLIYRQAVETLRCLSEGVLRTEVDGNIGSVLAIGFPRHTGGALQFIRGVGRDVFKARCDALAAAYGARFAVSAADLDRLDGSVRAAA
ncbi:3-hydroxyacyl-CoA dehydrogenase NAD-binding domain-containing protein [Methylobacterium sp. ID0610]|uniref:3-hydroxyacyl-CoA dehydrogenase NAD-binding domain-containing protein n=1 Tax=Methylobacterium carpenticola TaxID=3344827 RepID=UPI00368F2CDF